MGTSSSEVRCCLWVVVPCWMGLEGDMLPQQTLHLGSRVPEHDLMKSFSYVFGPPANRQVLPLFPPSSPTSSHKGGFSPVLWHLIISMVMKQWCPKHMTSPRGYAEEKGSFGGLMSLVGIWNPPYLDPMPLKCVSRPCEGMDWSDLFQTSESALSLLNNLELGGTFFFLFL